MEEILVLRMLAAVCSAGVFFEAAGLLYSRGRTVQTEGTVVEEWTVMQRPNAKCNSKWVRMHYTVDGKPYTSDGRVQVPMACRTGSVRMLRVWKNNPRRLCRCSGKRLWGWGTALALSVMALWLLG